MIKSITDWLGIAIIKQIFKKQSNTPWNRQHRCYELRYRTSKTYDLLLFRISVWFGNKLLIGVACKHFRMFWAKLLLRVRSDKFWKWILDPARAQNHSLLFSFDLQALTRSSSILNPLKARGPDVLWKAIHHCQMNNSRLITTLEHEFKTFFKGLRFHHALWGWSHYFFSNHHCITGSLLCFATTLSY